MTRVTDWLTEVSTFYQQLPLNLSVPPLTNLKTGDYVIRKIVWGRPAAVIEYKEFQT